MASLEYLTIFGWVVGHGDTALLDPQKYLDKLYANRGIYARYDTTTYPTYPRPDPIPRGLVPITRIAECAECHQPHSIQFECLL